MRTFSVAVPFLTALDALPTTLRPLLTVADSLPLDATLTVTFSPPATRLTLTDNFAVSLFTGPFGWTVRAGGTSAGPQSGCEPPAIVSGGVGVAASAGRAPAH